MKKILAFLLITAMLCTPVVASEEESAGYDLLFPYENGVARAVTDEKWGLIDAEGNELLAPTWDYIEGLQENRRLVTKNLAYGFIDENHKTVIEPLYTQASGFSEGLACVRNSEGKWGYIAPNGTVAIPFIYDEANSFSDSLALIKKEGLYGYIDKDNNPAIPCQYQEAYPFSEKLACVAKDGLYGYIDIKGEVVIPCNYSLAFDFAEGAAVIQTETGYGLIDSTGSFLIKPTWEYLSSRVQDGLLIAQKNGRLGLIDTNDNARTAFIYEEIGAFSEGLAPACTEDGYGYIDTNGQTVIDHSFDAAKPFSEGYAAVKENELFGYIDSSGELVADFIFQDAGLVCEGKAPVQNSEGKWLFVNPEQISTPPKADEPLEVLEDNTLCLQIGSSVLQDGAREMTLEAAPILENGVTMLPIRAVIEAIGGIVNWEPEEKKISLFHGTHAVVLRLDEGGAFVDGRFTLLAAKPLLKNNRTLIPLRFVLEAFDCSVRWEPESQKIYIQYPEI
ncbi:MAG: WG repeat-containing protein [Clostridia bacterium]|nr:WG repeat-containing protein [Clostridia bacterium]